MSRSLTLIFSTLGVLLIAVSYLALAYYNELRALFVRQEPKVLALESKQCMIADEKKNQHKLMFVSCSGFYDEGE